VGKYFTKEEMVKISTSLFYNRLLLWSKSMASCRTVIKRKLWQVSIIKNVRIAQKRLAGTSKNCLTNCTKLITGRATPKMWSNCVQCCALFDVIMTGKPSIMLCKLMESKDLIFT